MKIRDLISVLQKHPLEGEVCFSFEGPLNPGGIHRQWLAITTVAAPEGPIVLLKITHTEGALE